MPRVTILLGEIGTTGDVHRFHVSQDAAVDIGNAVELEHPCEDDPSCDIAAALRGGFPYSAAYLLAGATETPLLDSVCQFHGFHPAGTYDAIPDWEDWLVFFHEHGKECPSCGAFSFEDESPQDVCGNCLASFPPVPSECDAFIGDDRNGYAVSVEQSYLGTFDTREDAERFLWNWTEESGFHPETWYVNERGNTELLVRTENPDDPYQSGNLGYV